MSTASLDHGRLGGAHRDQHCRPHGATGRRPGARPCDFAVSLLVTMDDEKPLQLTDRPAGGGPEMSAPAPHLSTHDQCRLAELLAG